MTGQKKELSANEKKEFLEILKLRFGKHKDRHKELTWENVATKLEENPGKLWSLHEMEISGGEPDVVTFDKNSREIIFFDCSPESPAGRRSLCYDGAALDARKEHKPKDSATEMAKEMGVELLDETEYRKLQELGKFDLKTSSWIQTPSAVRKHGGALFCDRRYDHVFTYHNGAISYYAARGFRAKLVL